MPALIRSIVLMVSGMYFSSVLQSFAQRRGYIAEFFLLIPLYEASLIPKIKDGTPRLLKLKISSTHKKSKNHGRRSPLARGDTAATVLHRTPQPYPLLSSSPSTAGAAIEMSTNYANIRCRANQSKRQKQSIIIANKPTKEAETKGRFLLPNKQQPIDDQ